MTVIADRVREVSNSSSTGPMTLEGTVVGFRRFRDAIADGATVPYVIENGSEWEVGYGSFTAPATLNRVTVKASSNAGAKVDFAAGQKSIWVDAIADFFQTTTAAVNSVNGQTGTVVLGKSDVGLGNVDNTSDANKPVSTATQTALDLKVNNSSLGAASGVATLGSDSKLTTSQLPDIAIVDYLGTVASQAAMLALTGQKGDWCIRSDLGTVWIITGANPAIIGGWTQLSYPTAPVTSVAGKTGAVTLVKADVGLSNVDNTSDASKPVSTATQTALDGKQATVTVNGIIKGNGLGTLSAAVAGTDYAGLGSANTFTNNQVISTSSSSDALRITQTGVGNALLVEDSANPDSTPFVVKADGRVLSGLTNPITTLYSNTPGVQINAQFDVQALALTRFGANQYGADIDFVKSRSGTVGSQTIVQSGDQLANLNFAGSDGTAFIAAAAISASVDGTPGTNDMPGRLVFSTTADGASSPTERMRIDNAGQVGIGGTTTNANVYNARQISGAANAYGFRLVSTGAPTVTNNLYGYGSALSTNASAYTLASATHFAALGTTIGAGSTLTNQYGYWADASLTGATNNYGFYSNIASGTGRWNFYAAGTADNYFAGNTTIAGTTTLNASLNGLAKLTSGQVSATTPTISVKDRSGATVSVAITLS